MTLSLNSIFQPLNDFFINLFKSDASSPVLFRFDRFGSAISDQDFINPSHPELGFSPDLAREKFSDLVNGIPVEDADGLNIFISQSPIDETYFTQLLAPSLPYLPKGIDDQTRDSIVSSFSQINQNAKLLWENISQESISGLMFKFKPSLATPDNWYDATKNDIWSHQQFQVSESSTSPPIDDFPEHRLWKLKIDNIAIQKLMPVNNTAQPVEPIRDLPNILRANTHPIIEAVAAAKPILLNSDINPAPMNTLKNATVNTQTANTFKPAVMGAFKDAKIDRNVTPALSDGLKDTIVVAKTETNFKPAAIDSLKDVRTYTLHDTYNSQLSQLPIRDKLLVVQYLKSNAPTQPSTTNEISISFDYCVVRVERPWYNGAFIHNSSWFIPNTPKGELTSKDNLAGNITLMPIGFVAIRNLLIEANWSASDIANSPNAIQFGPFNVNSTITNNILSHQGVQIIGWLLERMPDLPPNDPPA
jgi:hypothetical protein